MLICYHLFYHQGLSKVASRERFVQPFRRYSRHFRPIIFDTLNHSSLLFQFVHHLNGLAQTYIVPMNPSTIDDADRALQSIETAKSLANIEWRKLESRVELVDDRDAAARHYKIWRSQLTEKCEDVLQRKRLLSRISELEHDFNDCSRKLDQFIDAACCPGDGDFSKDYLKKLEAINSEVMCLRNTVPVSLFDFYVTKYGIDLNLLFFT